MKREVFLLVILLLLPAALAKVEIQGYVNDYAEIIDEQYTAEIESIARNLQSGGTAEYAVVTIKSLEGRDIEGYSFELAEGKLGDKEKNNGLLLLVAVDDRKYRFEVGRGLEPILNDAKIGRIGRLYLVENFRKNDYGNGILEASKAVQAVIDDDTQSVYYTNEETKKGDDYLIFFLWIAFIVLFFLPFIWAIRYSHKKKGKFFDAALMAGYLFSGRGGSSGGHFGGGFGGGSFGGGGASGGW